MFSTVRRCTMSRSNVVTGAPERTPAIMPTTMNETSWRGSRAKRSAIRALFIQLSNRQDRFHDLLQDTEAFQGGEVDHPADLLAIDTVRVKTRVEQRCHVDRIAKKSF